MNRIFLLSPAYSGGERARMLFNERAQFDLARRLRLKTVPLGEVFSFLSGLYFRGKLAYARAFANPPRRLPGALVITTNRGLLNVETPVDLKQVQAFSTVEIDEKNPGYREPLIRSATELFAQLGKKYEVVLLGSIATGKYVEILLDIFAERLLFPSEFVGRGDMSRGGLMLRSASDRCELRYVPVLGAIRHGKRPEKLKPRKRESRSPVTKK